MTQDVTKFGVEVDDGKTTEKVGKNIEQLTDIVKNASKTAREARKEIKALKEEAGGTPGSRKIAGIVDEITTYTRQRGSAALTGAAGRDFAAQAQGLDGLVRLYATYAANVFALGAAFRALGQAMDTTNMIEGLNQLGAVVGRNLGGLSKRVEELSGGAVSMREAMQAVALTSSGGMSSKNIERMASVARSASVALGVSMPDAMSRLSRAITKLEPELLDELGIMTRLEPSMQQYAREMGKTVTQLTQFERQQAFANAVLAEGEAKFGAIANIQTNPYDRLVASLKDVSQAGIGVINKALGPIAEFLASSPTVLIAGLISLTSMIVKQAIPAIGEFKQKLQESANTAANLAKSRVSEALTSEKQLSQQIIQEANNRAIKYLDAVESAEEKIKAIRSNSIKGFTEEYGRAIKIINKLNVGAPVTQEDIESLEKKSRSLDKKGLKDQALVYKEVSAAIREYTVAQEQAIIQIRKEEAALSKGSRASVISLNRKLALAAEQDAIKKSIVSNAAYNASLIGVARAAKIMDHEIRQSTLTLGFWGKTVLQVQGYGAMFAGALSTIGNAAIKLTNAFAWVSIVGSLLAILDHYFSGSRVEADKFNKSIDDTKASLENIKRTITQLETQLNSMTINGIIAAGNAMEDFTGNLSTMLSQVKKAKAEMDDSFWNSMVNKISRLWSGDINSKFRATILDSVKGVVELVAKTGLKEETEKSLKDILGINTFSLEELKRGVLSLSDDGLKRLEERLISTSKELSNSASRVQGFRQATESATRMYQQFIQSTANTSPLFRVGAALQTLGATMFQSAQEAKLGINEINASINELSERPEATVIFGSTFVENLLDTREEFLAQSKAIELYKRSLVDLDKEISKSKYFKQFLDTDEKLLDKSELAGVNKLKDLSKSKEEVEKSINLMSEAQSKKARDLFIDGMNTALSRGAELIRVSLGQAMEKGAIAISKATLAGLTGAERARAENAIAKQELDIQLRAIQTNIDLILSQALLRASIDKSTASTALLSARQSGKSDAEIKALESIEQASDIFYKIIKEGQTPNFANIGKFTSDESILNQVMVRGVGDSQRIAEQNEAKILLDAQRQALGISGAINIRSGQLEDTQKLLGLQQQVIQNDVQRVSVLNQISGINSEIGSVEQARVERNTLLLKQSSELAAINTAIANAQGNKIETLKQEEFKQLMLSRHERELELQFLTSSQRVIQANVEALSRQLDLVRAINDNTYKAGVAQVDILTAQNTSYNTLYGASTGFAALQSQITGDQKAQLDYIKAIGEANIAYAQKEDKARRDIALLDPERDVSRIYEINAALDQQNSQTKIALNNAKIQLETQKDILDTTKSVAMQQDRYNRILSNSAKISDSLSKSFGKLGSSLGIIAEAFGALTVNSDKNIKELKRIQEAKIEAKGDTQKLLELDQEYNIQKRQYNMEQLSGIASIAGASKNFFDEQSTGYKIMMAIEKAMYAAHVAMSIAQLAMDAKVAMSTAAKTSAIVGGKIVETEASGIAAITKTLAELPTPINFAMAGVMAALVAGLVASVAGLGGGGGKGKIPNIPSGMSSADMQSTQGTGKKYANGILVDTAGGALGASSDKVADIANSIELIENNTAITSSYSTKTLNTLRMIEKHTKSTAAEVLKSTNIGKAVSGFGTIEKQAAPTGGIFSKSKSVEIIDKGISVVGKFIDVLSGTALFQEYETIKTTKTKSSLFGSKTKVRISSESKELSLLTEESVIQLFSSLADTVLSASKLILGKTNSDIQSIINDFNVDFKVSGLDMDGEQFAQEILAQSNVVMNEILGLAVPQLELFRKLGEGFTGTLVRMATTVDVVTNSFNLFGKDINSIVQDAFSVSPETMGNIANSFITYTDALENIVSSALNGASNNIVKESMQDQINDYLTQFYNIESTPGIKETDFQLMPDQILSIAKAEEDLMTSRNQIIKDLGLSSMPIIEDLNLLQTAYTKAKLAILNNVSAQKDLLTVDKLLNGELQISNDAKKDARAGINKEVRDLYTVTIDLNRATETVTKAFSDQKFVTLAFYDTLVESAGGLEAFTEKTSFFFENFYSEEEQLAAKTSLVTKSLTDFANQGVITNAQLIMLTDGAGNLREEYRSVVDLIVESGGLLTESGRSAWDTLITFSTAIEGISEPIESTTKLINKSLKDLLDEFGLTAETFSDIFSRAILTDDSIEDLGGDIADTIRSGYLKAVSSGIIDTISNSFVDSVIGPILNSVVKWNDTDYTVAASNFTQLIGSLTTNATNLSNMLANPIFSQAINQATTLASIAITRLTNSIRNSDNIFSRTKLLEYTTELQDLQKEFETSTLQKAIEQEQTRLDILEEQADVLKSSMDTLKDFLNGLKDFKASLLIGSNSPLTPLDKYSEIKSQLESAFQTSTLGATEQDRELSRQKIQELSSSFLDISRSVYASGTQYTNDFNFVQSILDSLITTTDTQLSMDEQQLQLLNSQIEASKQSIELSELQLSILDDSNSQLTLISDRIAELNSLIARENEKARNNITDSFTILDSNLDNKLTLEELKTSGIASDDTLDALLNSLDTNGDGQITRLEAIVGSTSGTFYTLQSIIPIIDSVSAGIITMNSGIAKIAEINSANIAKGGGSISGSYSPGSGYGYDNGLLGYISNGIVYGINGQTISAEQAVSTLQELAKQTSEGKLPAKNIYNLLKTWGINSSMVASLLGVTKTDVLDWFKAYDSSIPAFKKGINSVPEDMLAQIHKDERIMPAADNRELMQSLSSRNDTNIELIAQLRELNIKIDKLEKTVAEGAIMNVIATKENAVDISKSVKDVNISNNFNDIVKNKVSIR